MKKKFREYHQFTEKEFKQLWNNCLFVFDTNTLLNMYRYSRNTVKEYFKVLNELKTKKQVWIPYQVGHEFYENRIDVIAEYEHSYDSILEILNKAKTDIESKYKDHPFLDLNDIKEKIEQGLSAVTTQIRIAEKKHPKWMDKDDVLDQINDIFEKNTGDNYDEDRLAQIIKEGKDRYEKKIPPGYKDNKKSDDKKYGDLILWYQIIDKAISTKKPVIFISGDVKEDWWLEKNGNRIMPLPQLKKELLNKAGVDFHIYTADRFLEYYTQEKKIPVGKTTISEVRKIRELEEKRMMMRRVEIEKRDVDFNGRVSERHLYEYAEQFALLQEIISEMNPGGRYKDELSNLLHHVAVLINRLKHGDVDRIMILRFHRYLQEIYFILERAKQSKEFNSDLSNKVRYIFEKFEELNHGIRGLF